MYKNSFHHLSDLTPEDYVMASRILRTNRSATWGDVDLSDNFSEINKVGWKFLVIHPSNGVPSTTKLERTPEIINPFSDYPFNILFESNSEVRNRSIEEIKKLPVKYAEKLYNRLAYLDEATLEEYPDQELISIESIEGFLRFFKIYSMFKYPDITITPDGNVRIQWQQDKSHHLALEFVSHVDVKFVVFSPDPDIPVKTVRVSGRATIKSIMTIIQPHNVLQWAGE